jgi:DNA-binding NtrC family response regulator
MPSTVFIVDDEKNIRRTVRMVLEGEGYSVEEASSGEEALARLAEVAADVMLLDVQLPGMSGLETIERIGKLKNVDALPTIIMISGHATLADAVRATKAGAYDLIEKPLDRERLMVALRNALERRAMEREVQGLRAIADERFEMVGKSAPMAALFAQITKVAPTRTRVLITGESGTGKELIARALHRASALADKPFVKVNCAAIPPELIESELFGHERGAFTGATGRKRGLFELADGGTIFLDEIGDMIASGAGEGAARAAVGRVHARRRRAGVEGRRPRGGRHQPRSAGRGRLEHVPRGSVLPAQRRAAARAAAARFARTTCRCCRGRSSSSRAARTA